MSVNFTNGRRAGEPDETRLLVVTSRPIATSADIAEIHEILTQPLDWTAFVECTLQHGVTPQAFGRLLDVAESEVPPDIATAARTHIDTLRARNCELIGQLLWILDAFRAAGIDIIPLKGPLLAHLVYGDATIRACRDLDFLVRHADIKRAKDVLRALGYYPYPAMPPLTARQQVAVNALSGQAQLWRLGAPAAIEPHWTLVPGNLRLAVDHDAMWQRSRLVAFAEREVRTLTPEDLMLVIAIHGGKDEWSKLQAVSDLARSTVRFDALDWRLVLERAKQQRCLRVLLTGMRLIERLMGLALPPAIAAACADHRGVDALAASAADQMLVRGPTTNSIFEISENRFRLHDRWWDRIRYVAATVLTPRVQHFGLVRLPDSLFFLYCPIKVVHDYVLLPVWLVFKQARAVSTARGKIGPNSAS